VTNSKNVQLLAKLIDGIEGKLSKRIEGIEAKLLVIQSLLRKKQ
jgi:hypothetical protein